jgi:hypothetical protein
MGQIRSLLRGYTLDYLAPADVLRRTNAAVCQLLPDAAATAFYAVLDLSSGDLAYANADHPPALLDNGEGHAGYLDGAPGVMLGASADTDYTASRGRLRPGARLLHLGSTAARPPCLHPGRFWSERSTSTAGTRPARADSQRRVAEFTPSSLASPHRASPRLHLKRHCANRSAALGYRPSAARPIFCFSSSDRGP